MTCCKNNAIDWNREIEFVNPASNRVAPARVIDKARKSSTNKTITVFVETSNKLEDVIFSNPQGGCLAGCYIRNVSKKVRLWTVTLLDGYGGLSAHVHRFKPDYGVGHQVLNGNTVIHISEFEQVIN